MDVPIQLRLSACRPFGLSIIRWMLPGVVAVGQAAWGATLGDIYVRSMIGQPLVAEIPIVLDPVEAASLDGGVEADRACADEDCSRRVFAALKQSTGHTGVLRIYSDLPVRTSGFKVHAWLRWASAEGKLVGVARTYSVRFPGGVMDIPQKSVAVDQTEVQMPSASTVEPRGDGNHQTGRRGAERRDPGQGSGTQEIAAIVRDWASAWSEKDMRSYLSFYADDYAPRGVERSEWVHQRTRRIAERDGAIDVRCEGLFVVANSANDVEVTFKQSYRTATLRSTGRKTMRLARIDGAWKIVEERMDGEQRTTSDRRRSQGR